MMHDGRRAFLSSHIAETQKLHVSPPSCIFLKYFVPPYTDLGIASGGLSHRNNSERYRRWRSNVVVMNESGGAARMGTGYSPYVSIVTRVSDIGRRGGRCECKII